MSTNVIKSCLGCQGERFAPWFVKRNRYGEYTVCRCRDCGSAFVAPRPSAEEIQAFYNSETYYQTEAESAQSQCQAMLDAEQEYAVGTVDADRIIGWCKEFAAGNRFLDIGSGYGLFSRCAREAGFDVEALDPSPTCRAVYEQLLGTAPMEGFLDEQFVAGREGRYDVILMSQVLEHVLDVDQAVTLLHRLLVPGGIAAIAVPQFRSWISCLQGKRDHFIVPPEHINYFTTQGLRRLFERGGFQQCHAESSSQFDPRRVQHRLGGGVFGKMAASMVGTFLNLADIFNKGLSINAYYRKPGF